MQRLLIAVLALFVVTATTGAAGADSKIVGKWKIVKTEGPGAADSKNLIYTFNADGTMNIAGATKATYTLDGAVLTINFTKTMKFVVDVEFKGDKTMIYKIRNSGGQIFTMEKQ